MSSPGPFQFTPDGYADLLMALREAGYRLTTVADARQDPGGRWCAVCHDVDAPPYHANLVAAVEHRLRVRATWFFGTRFHYNLLHPRHVRLVRWLAGFQHEIGLHYALGQRELDLCVLRVARGQPSPWEPTSLCLHRPSDADGTDHFAADLRNVRLLPAHYVSDSRRRWTGDYLERALAGEPERVRLTTHPEHWAGRLGPSAAYLADCLEAWDDEVRAPGD